MEILTLKKLKELKPGIFAQGEFTDAPDYHTGEAKLTEENAGKFLVNIANTGKVVRWVAVRGDIHDWAVYVQNPHYVPPYKDELVEQELATFGYNKVWDWEEIRRNGDKIFPDNARKLVPANDEAMRMYRD